MTPVSVHFMYIPDQLASLATNWKSLAARKGFNNKMKLAQGVLQVARYHMICIHLRSKYRCLVGTNDEKSFSDGCDL